MREKFTVALFMIKMLRCLALGQLVRFVTFEVKESVHERAISTFDVEHEEQGQSADDDHPAHEINPSHRLLRLHAENGVRQFLRICIPMTVINETIGQTQQQFFEA